LDWTLYHVFLATTVQLVRSEDFSLLVRSKDFSPLVRSKDFSPLVRSKDFSPLVRSKDFSPLVRSKDFSPLVRSKDFSPLVFCGLKSSLRTLLEFYSFGFLRTEVLTTNLVRI
jgi:hypothetical protein